MSRKHFEAIAAALRASRPASHDEESWPAWRVWDASCTNIAEALFAFNPAFDRFRFLTACSFFAVYGPHGDQMRNAAS